MADLLTSIRAELDARLSELRPAVAEYERLLSAADALVSDADGHSVPERGVSAPATPAPGPRRAAPVTPRARTTRPNRPRERTPHGAAGQAILAALEHGSHTVSELSVVTALSARDIRDSLHRLRGRRAIVKTDRDGRTAYALPATAEA